MARQHLSLLFTTSMLLSSCSGIRPQDPDLFPQERNHIGGVDVGDPSAMPKLMAMKGKKEVAKTVPLTLHLESGLILKKGEKYFITIEILEMVKDKKDPGTPMTRVPLNKLQFPVSSFPLEIDLGLDSSVIREGQYYGSYLIEVSLIQKRSANLGINWGAGRLFLKEGESVGSSPLVIEIQKSEINGDK